MNKICTKCGNNKDLEEYYKDNRTKDGRQSECKSCHNLAQTKYEKSAKGRLTKVKYRKTEKSKLSGSRYRKSDEGKLARSRYRKSEKGKLMVAKINTRYNKSEKGKSTIEKYFKSEEGKLARIRGCHNRRIHEANVIKDFTTKESNIILFLQNYKCIYPDCIDYFDEVIPTLDHILPVSKGGPLIKENVQYLCQKHNSKKGAKYIDYRTQTHKEIIATI